MGWSISNGGLSPSDVQTIIKSNTGWAQYSDTQYTSTTPLVVAEGSEIALTNNAGQTITSHLPLGIAALYDGTTNKITPENSGDSYILRIDFTAFSTSNTGYGEIKLNVGGAVGQILDIPVNFPRGTGILNARELTRSTLMYSLDTFIQNGGTLSYESVRGSTSIYDIVFVISRIHKA